MESDKPQPPVDTMQPIAGGLVINKYLPADDGDPFERLFELMELVEQLCPRWPERETFKDSEIFLL